ncbi:uncharacterized protein V6R79_023327 [Siganus canaliculatus]
MVKMPNDTTGASVFFHVRADRFSTSSVRLPSPTFRVVYSGLSESDNEPVYSSTKRSTLYSLYLSFMTGLSPCDDRYLRAEGLIVAGAK